MSAAAAVDDAPCEMLSSHVSSSRSNPSCSCNATSHTTMNMRSEPSSGEGEDA